MAILTGVILASTGQEGGGGGRKVPGLRGNPKTLTSAASPDMMASFRLPGPALPRGAAASAICLHQRLLPHLLPLVAALVGSDEPA